MRAISLAVLVDRQVGREVGRRPGVEAGRLEVEVLDQQQARRPDRLDGQRLALGDDQALLVAEPRRGRGRDQEEDQPGVREQRRQLRVLVAIAVDEARAVGVGRLADAEAVAPQDGADGLDRDAVHRGAVGEPRVEVGLRLGDPDVADTPRHSFGVRSSVQTTIETTRTTSAALNHGERKTAKSERRSMTSTTAAPRTGS